MPVFNIAANQQLARPVDAMYEGKAIRLAIKNKELANTAMQQEIDANLPERKMADSEARTGIYSDQEDRLQAAAERDIQAQTAEIGINAAMSGYDAYHATEGDEATKKQAGYDATLSVIDNMVPGGRDAALEFIRESQGREYTPEDFDVNEARALITPFLEKGKEGDSEFERLIADMPPEMQARLKQQRAEKLSSFAPKENKPTYDPPNKVELETAEALVKDDEVLDDLSGKEKRVATMILANDIRQLQEDLGIDYATAARTAINQLKRKVKLEPDFLTGTDAVLDLDDEGLAENEYLIDGVVYIREDDGSIRAKD